MVTKTGFENNGELTPEQYDVVIDKNKEILCLACAGSGKSRTLAYRIARLISEGAKPESIIAFTFTKKAAESIKRRVADALDKCGFPIEMVGAIHIGTIHAYCQKLLGSMNAKYMQYDVLDENRLKLFILSRYFDLELHELQKRKKAKFFQTISEVSKAWQMANDEMMDFDEIQRSDFFLGKCLNNINKMLDSDQYIDFSLMIRKVVESLEKNNSEINSALEYVKHLMVDEYQDVNISQERLISGLYNRAETLFVVGDDDQSIYGWRGADVRNIIEFDQRYPNCSTHTLSVNFRSIEEIVNASNEFIQIELSTGRIGKNPKSHSNGNANQVGNYWFKSREEEAQWVAKRIKELIGLKYIEADGVARGLCKSDIAILMRSVQSGRRNTGAPYHRDFTNAFKDHDLDYIIEAEGSIFERLHAKILRETMKLLEMPGISRTDAIDYFNSNVLPVYPKADKNDFLRVLENWNNKIHRPIKGARRKVYPQVLVHDLLKSFNVSITTFNNHEQVMRDLGVFSSIILDVEKVFVSIDTKQRYCTILRFLDNIAETGYDTSQVELMSRPDAITVSTVHKMKGLEFPVIFIVDVVQQRFPGRNMKYNGWLPKNLLYDTLSRGLYQGGNAAEARLFYTAMTRAERFLYITGSSLHLGLAREKKPSSFKLRLEELDSVTFESDFSIFPANIEKTISIPRIDEESMPTSFTEIKDYLECPMIYKFRKIYGFCPAVPELFGYGLTTHTAINRLHQLFVDSPPDRKEAQRIAEEVFHLKHVFASKNSQKEGPYERAREASKKLVGSYAEDYPDDFIQSRSLEQRFEVKAGKAIITGAIDLLLKQDDKGEILDAKVIDFKSMEYDTSKQNSEFWINLALQVQLYAHAAKCVLEEKAKTGMVHMLKAPNNAEQTNRIEIPITEDAVNSAMDNIKWAVERILVGDFPKRSSKKKCESCDFNKICSKQNEEFLCKDKLPAIKIPKINDEKEIQVQCFSDVD